MKTMRVEEAKEAFSALVSAAERGEPTTIVLDGKPMAVLVSAADGLRLYPPRSTGFVDFLLEFPGGVEVERDPTPLRDLAL